MKNIEVPNQAAENLESLEDEEILELTEETAKLSEEDDDDILELNDIEDETLEKDEEILDLTDLEEEDEDVVDLTDIEDQSLEQEEEIIDLSDIEDNPQAKSESASDIDLLDKNFLDLEESEEKIVTKTDTDTRDEEVSKESLFETAFESAVSQHTPVQENLQAAPTSEPESFSLSQEQLETALENVIKKMFAEKIDSILVEVIEKSVTKEIERLKDILIEDAKDDLKL